MRKLFSIGLYIVGGFFLYMVSLLAFMKGLSLHAKWLLILVFTVLGALALAGGLAVGRFQNWRRDAGVVLLSATGFTLFVIFTFACLLIGEEFRRMIPPDTLTFFSDYVTGIVVIVVFAVAGTLLLKSSRRRVEQTHAPDALPRAGDT
jgi:hypothetical protein